MATTTDLLLDGYGRVQERVHAVLEGLGEDALTARLDPQANTIAWLVWHLTRVQDDHLADVAGTEQVWTAGGWYDRFGLPFPPQAHGFGMSTGDVAAVSGISAEDLRGYYDAVHEATVAYVRGLTDAELDRVVDDQLGSAGDARGAAGQRHRRRPRARRPGGLHPRRARATLTAGPRPLRRRGGRRTRPRPPSVPAASRSSSAPPRPGSG